MAYECLKRLYKEELYSNVIYLGNLLMTTIDRCPDYLSPMNRYQACVYYADSLLYLKSAKRAESIYMKALSLRKVANAHLAKSPPQNETRKSAAATSEYTSETEVKYKLHICLVKQTKFKEAVGLLESIPSKQRSAKINSALGQLYKRLNLVQAAVQAFKDLLVACPCALEAMNELLQYGLKVDDLKGLLGNSSNAADLFNGSLDWFPLWLDGTAFMAQRDYPQAVQRFQDIDTKTPLANNPVVLCNLALSYYSGGEYAKASATLQRVHTLDPLHVECMDILAGLLGQEKRLKELESLATQMMTTSPECRQSWVAMGYLCRALKKLPKALYFAHKACGDGRSRPYVESMLLKGLILLDLKKYAEASLHFQEVLQSNLFRYELYEGLVTCHLERNKLKDARTAAALCLKQTGHTARGLTLYATVLAKDSSTLAEAQALLERAVSSAPYLLNAVYLLVSIYDRQKQYDKAIELLKRQTSVCVNSKLHGMLGEILGKSTQHLQAADSYRFALTLDPSDEASLAGLADLATSLVTASTQTTQFTSTRLWAPSSAFHQQRNASVQSTAAPSSSADSSSTAAMATPDAATTLSVVAPPAAPSRPIGRPVLPSAPRTSSPDASMTAVALSSFIDDASGGDVVVDDAAMD